MSEMLPRPVEERKAEEDGEVEIDAIQRVLDEEPRNFFGPWCRVCRREASWWHWRQIDAEKRSCTVRCHGEEMVAEVPIAASLDRFRLEVFCFDEPRMETQPIWWVCWDGSMAQESRPVIAHAVAAGGLFSTPGMQFLRRNAWAPVLITLTTGISPNSYNQSVGPLCMLVLCLWALALNIKHRKKR